MQIPAAFDEQNKTKALLFATLPVAAAHLQEESALYCPSGGKTPAGAADGLVFHWGYGTCENTNGKCTDACAGKTCTLISKHVPYNLQSIDSGTLTPL